MLLRDLKKVMYDLVMMTLARASWLSSYPDTPYLKLAKDIRDQGTLAFVLVSKYTRSKVALKCDQESTVQDVSLYSALVCATNELRNALLPLHDLVRRNNCLFEEREPMLQTVDDTQDSGCIKFHEVPGMRRLDTDISIQPYPVTMDGSIEFETALNALQAEEATMHPSTSSRHWMLSPWATDLESVTDEDDEKRDAALASSDSVPSLRGSMVNSMSSSVMSLDLRTDFVDIDGSPSGEVDSAFRSGTAPKRESTLDFSISTAKDLSSIGSSAQSPFETQQPKKLPTAAASGWGSINSSDGISGDTVSSSIVGVVSSGLVKDVLAVDLVPGPMIGKGSEGHVLQMSYHETPVAVKIMNHTCHRTRERFKNETKLLSKLTPHQNIVNFVGRCTDLKAGEQNKAADLVMVMEFCDLGNLYKIISEAKWIRQLHEIGRDLTEFKDCFGYSLYSSWRRRLEIARDIAAGAAHMHQHGIVHRDLTSFNVVLKKGDNKHEWIAKICDFERSRFIPPNQVIPRSDNIANSPAWSAPEILREDPYSVQADVFSLGVILWELWTLEEPWKHPEQEIRNPMLIIPEVGNGGRLQIPSTSSSRYTHLSELKSLIQNCWNEDPSARPPMFEVHQRLVKMLQNMSSQ